ncbi:transcription factor SOX-3-like [Frankliniella occidentalis]|uniref:Sex-determining region Y protein n=1 Tax=Frankliniella occidentalis TaxID=133901 RepID=A0A9C6X8T8_FRAOC|nr:transcription factor SOX-3-like [Frankliniella occidentalis]
MSVFLRSGCQDKDGRSLARTSGGPGGPVGILGPTRRPLQMHTTRTLARRGVVGVVPALPARPPSAGTRRAPSRSTRRRDPHPLLLGVLAGDGITLNSNVFTVCSASISPDPPEEPAALPRRPVVLSTSSTLLRKRPVEPQRALEEGAAAAAQSGSGAASRKDRIPRPPNAFMLFANEFRKKLSCENPRESNKDISVRLGTMWKMMTKEKKDTYFELARLVDAEHKKKYPDYVYNPKEARLRKAMRDQVRCRSQGVRTPGASAGATAGASAVTPATARPPQSPHSPASPMKKKILLSPRLLA